MKERGKFLGKERWFSICSIHAEFNRDCDLCNTGTWENIWRLKISSMFYKLSPKLWIWWVNNARQRGH